MRNILVATIFLITSFFWCSSYARAEGDFMVSPAHRELLVHSGESKAFAIALTNRTDRNLLFRLSAEDFAPNERNGEATLLGQSSGEHSLKGYILAPVSSIPVAAGQTINIPITINIPKTVRDPNLYGALVVETGNYESGAESGARVSSRIAVGIFVRTTEQFVANGHLVSFIKTAPNLFDNGPARAEINYANKGDVYLTPSGVLSLKNILGIKSAEKIVEPWYVLPGSARGKSEDIGGKYLFGRYTLKLQIGNGLGGNLEEAEVSFWILSWRIMLIVLGGLLCLVLIKRTRTNTRSSVLKA